MEANNKVILINSVIADNDIYYPSYFFKNLKNNI